MRAESTTKKSARKAAVKPGPEYFSVSELSRLTKLDRATIAKRLSGTKSKLGDKGAKTYLLKDALPKLIAGESAEMDIARLRKAQADAELREHELAVEREEVLEVSEIREHLIKFNRALYNELAKRAPREIAAQLRKAESTTHIIEILQHEYSRRFNDIRKDHQRFL
jgi:hypothetical protein